MIGFIRQGSLLRLLGIASGLMLVTPHLYPPAAPLQAVALLPLLFAATWPKAPLRLVVVAGLYAGLACAAPQVIALEMPTTISLILILDVAVMLAVFAGVARWLLHGPAVAGALAAAALLTALDWANFTLVPLWGTAQSLVRPWSRYPAAIQFVSFTGITGIVFALTAVQALAVNLVRRPKQRLAASTALVTVVIVFLAANLAARQRGRLGTLKVAAIGWTTRSAGHTAEPLDAEAFETRFARPLAEAAAQGAKLIVSPEAAFAFGQASRQEWLKRLDRLAWKHRVHLAIGYFDPKAGENRLLFMAPKGDVLGEYTKTHLTPFEHYHAGAGRPVVVDLNGLRLGGMICQDDNFTDLSRAYGRAGTNLLAVPTNDWRAVRDAHLQNTIHRAIETRCAIIRAASNGISAIVSPAGEVLASRDHFAEGDGPIVAEVTLRDGGALFSTLGHWPPIASLAYLAGYVVWLIRRRRWGTTGA